MAITKKDCVRALRKHGASESEALDIVADLMAEKGRLQEKGLVTPQDLSEAWSRKVDSMQREALASARRQAISLIRYREAADFVDSVKAQGFTGMDAIQALMVGSSKRFDGARNSVSALREGIFKSWMSPLLTELEAVDNGAALRLMREDKAFHDDIFREMREPGSTGNKSAQQVGAIFGRYMEQARQQLNAAGADIGRLDGWSPQNHDPYKLLKGGEQGREEWIDFVFQRLDLERTFDGMGTVDTARAKEILSGVYDTLTLGKAPHVPGVSEPTGSGPRRLTKRMEQSRVLHFKDAEAALEYHDTYGRGNIFDAMYAHLERDARALSLLERLGPNPQMMLERLLKREQMALRDNGLLSQEGKRGELQKIMSAAVPGIRPEGRVLSWLAELTGESSMPVGQTFARVMSIARATQTLSKLGAASLSAIADVFVKAANMHVNGENWLSSISKSVGQYFQSFGNGRREAARQVGAFMDSVRSDIAARWDDNTGTPGMIADLQDKLFRWSGLNWITERGKAGYSLWLAEHLGEVSDKTLDQLDPSRRAMLEYHGVTQERWEAMRKMVRQGPDGIRYFCPEDAVRLTGQDLENLLPQSLQNSPSNPKKAKKWQQARNLELERIRRNLQFDSMAMIADETRFAIIEPDDATRAFMRQGTRPGTFAGEFWRAAMQFKSFPIAYMQRVMGGRRWVRGEKQKGMRYGFNAGAVGDALTKDMGGLMGFVLSSIAFGYVAMTAKDISKGRTPRDPRKKETWLAAIMQSGGAGIYGDFLLGKVNRFGNDFASTLVGPLSGAVVDAVKVGGQLVRGEFEHAGEDALRLTMDNAPFVNLWFTRSALDWGLIYHMREMMSPGTLARTERKMRTEFGQEFLFPPSRYIRRGGGWR